MQPTLGSPHLLLNPCQLSIILGGFSGNAIPYSLIFSVMFTMMVDLDSFETNSWIDMKSLDTPQIDRVDSMDYWIEAEIFTRRRFLQ